MIDVVIPARNESATIAAIVQAFMEVPSIGWVIVVDDASTDDTAALAATAGAWVEKGPALGKGEAMALGLDFVRTDRVIFCDADLRGFTSRHAELLAQDFPGMVRGTLESHNPDLSGMRAVPTWLPRVLALHGYAAESQMELVGCMIGMPIRDVALAGVYDAYGRSRSWNWGQPHPDKAWLAAWGKSVAPGLAMTLPSQQAQHSTSTRWACAQSGR